MFDCFNLFRLYVSFTLPKQKNETQQKIHTHRHTQCFFEPMIEFRESSARISKRQNTNTNFRLKDEKIRFVFKQKALAHWFVLCKYIAEWVLLLAKRRKKYGCMNMLPLGSKWHRMFNLWTLRYINELKGKKSTTIRILSDAQRLTVESLRVSQYIVQQDFCHPFLFVD